MKRVFIFVVSAVLLSSACNRNSGGSAAPVGQIASQPPVHAQTQVQPVKETEGTAEGTEPQSVEPSEPGTEKAAEVAATAPAAPVAAPAPKPEGCPAPVGITWEDCSLAYTGIGFLAAVLTLHTDDLKVSDLLSDARINSDDPKCVPTLNKLVKKIHGHWFHHICPKADMRDVREIINDANNRKIFCQKYPTGDQNDVLNRDLFSSKRVQAYVIEKLKDSSPELCK